MLLLLLVLFQRQRYELCTKNRNLKLFFYLIGFCSFRNHGKSFALDTIYPNGMRQAIESGPDNNYASYVRHKDSPILNTMIYDRKDAKLIYWTQSFIHDERISTLDVYYNKKGEVDYFYDFNWLFEEDYIAPTYSFYLLMDKLKEENVDLIHNTRVYYYKESFLKYTTSSYSGWAWHVEIKDDTDDMPYNVEGRLYSGQTGELLEVYRGKWKDVYTW